MPASEARQIVDQFQTRFASPAAERNREPIREALSGRLPASGRVLEVACGALQHALTLSHAHPALDWQPTEIDPRILAAADAYLKAQEVLGQRPPQLRTPVELDVCSDPWPWTGIAAVYTANLLHISPPTTIDGLMKGASSALEATGKLFVYGPFRIAGAFCSSGDEAFDQRLRERNPAWGIRDLEAVEASAAEMGLMLSERVAMPANNWLLTFERADS